MAPHSNDPSAGETAAIRMLVIDDDEQWCKLLGHFVRSIGYTLDAAANFEEAQRMISDAERLNRPYAIAIIDMNFKVGGFELVQGEEIVEYIKANHPYMGCVVASVEKVLPDRVLDLRDNKGLDYYLQKDRISIDKVRKAVQRSLQRTQASGAGGLPVAGAASESHQPASAPQQPGTAQGQTVQVHLDFEQRTGDTRITWRAPLLGREESRFSPPYGPAELPLVIRSLDVLQYPHYPDPLNEREVAHFSFSPSEREVLSRLGLWAGERVAAEAFQTVGGALYAGLGGDGQRVLKAVSNASIAQGQMTNYVLRFPPDAIDLAALPWELLWDQERNQAVLIRGHTIDSCERYVDLDVAIPPPLPAGQKLHALALAPTFGIPAEVREAERAARLRSWERLSAAGKLSYAEVGPLTMVSLNDHLLNAEQRPDIIHYFGHGTYRNGKGYLIFDDGKGGYELINTERLAATLGDVRLVVIHACQSAMIDGERGLLTGIAPALSVVSGAVVAMQLTVRTEAATRFAQIFYDQLLDRGRSLQEAVARGRQVLFTEAADGASWYVPTLYIRSRTTQPVFFTHPAGG